MNILKQLPSSKSFLSNLNKYIQTHPFVTLFLALIMISVILVLIFMLKKKVSDSKKTDQQLILHKLISDGFQPDRNNRLTKRFDISSASNFQEIKNLKFPVCIHDKEIQNKLKLAIGFKLEDNVQFVTSDPKLIASCKNKNEKFSDYNDFSNEEEEEDDNSNKFFTSELNHGCYVKVSNDIDSKSYYFYKNCPDNLDYLEDLDELNLLDNNNSTYGNLDSGEVKSFRLCGENPTDIIPINELDNSLYEDIGDTENKFNVIPDNELRRIKIKFPDLNLDKFYYQDEYGRCHLPMKLKKYVNTDNKAVLIEVNINSNTKELFAVVE